MVKQLHLTAAFLLVSLVASAQVPHFKPGFNLFSKDQDIQLGREAAAQVEKQMEVVNNPELQNYINRLGQKLAAQPQAGGFPYTFKVVNDPSINAFALPGGPMFINTGLFKAADNEAQLVGVMAHEMSHVALRHGTNQASKANLIQIPAALAGAVFGGGNGSMLGQLAQLGIGLGANSVLLKFSRTDENQADLNGAQIMASAGYNPIELARFFEKLEAQGGHGGPQFLSDHPNPGNRVKSVQDEIRQMPQRSYVDDSPEFHRAKEIAASIPPPRGNRARGLTSSGGPSSGSSNSPDLRPSGQFRQVQGQTFTLAYPDNWETFGDKQGAAMTIAPRAALAQDQGGNVQIGEGVMVSYYLPDTGDNTVDLNRDTQALIRTLQRANPSMEVGNQRSRRISVGGQPALATTVYSQSPYQGETEHDTVVTVARPEGLFYMIFIAPARAAGDLSSTFDQIIRSIRFNN